MKRLFKLSLVFFCCVIIVAFSSGHEKYGTELVELMVIQGIGIDKTDKGFRVTIQAINNTQNSFVNGQGSPENVAKQYSNEGESVAEALEKTIRLSGKKPMYAHNRIIIIGEKNIKEDVALILDFFAREYNTKPTVLVALARGCKAEEIITAQVGADTLTSQLLENIVEESANYGEVNLLRVYEAVSSIRTAESSLMIPCISLDGVERMQGKESAQNNQKVVYMNGIAVFNKENRLVGYLDGDKALGTAILNDTLQEGIFRIDLEEPAKSAVLSIGGLRTKTKVRYENGRVFADVNVKLHCDLVELTGGNFLQLDKTMADMIITSAERKIQNITDKTVADAQKDFGVDLFRYGRRLWIFHKKEYDAIANEWHKKFSEAEITVTVDVTLRRTGEGTLYR